MRYMTVLQDILEEVVREEEVPLSEAVSACTESIAAGRGVLLFGAGHSALPCMEAFPRIGSPVGFIQITEPVLSYNGHVVGKGGQRQMSFLERTSGLAEAILKNYHLTPRDTLVVISNSGINALPVELCAEANRQGVTTIGLGSRAHSEANQPLNPAGSRLLDIASIPIDNHLPPGDALITLGEDLRVGAGSTVIHMMILNAVIVETAAALQARGHPLVVYPSHNESEDGEELRRQEEAVYQAYRELLSVYHRGEQEEYQDEILAGNSEPGKD